MGDSEEWQDRWSATPMAAEVVELPWGLSRAALRRAVPMLDAGTTITAEHEIQGLHQRGA